MVWSKAKPMFPSDPFLRLVDPSRPRPTLPETVGTGIQKVHTLILSSVGQPKHRAVDYLKRFVSEKHEGYWLTHQYFALRWFRHDRGELPPELEEKERELLIRIHDEQVREQGFSDLYAERVALLLLSGKNVERENVESWIKKIIKNQKPTGDWGEHDWNVEYEGETAPVRRQVIHTHMLCLTAIHCFLELDGPS